MNATEAIKNMQCLTFTLGEEVYAVNVSKVQSILDYTRITKVPKSPDYMRGVFNLRGSVVPVVDLKLKFGMGATEKTENTCIIVLEVTIGGETTILGALADSVQEVVDLEPGQIEAAPRIGSTLNTDFIQGMGKKEEDFIIILDIDKIFSVKEIDTVKASHARAKDLPETE
jgi:purine-binding chemotaxis protein CheW